MGGSVNKGETFLQAALRETREEAGINIKIPGVLKIDQSVKEERNSMRVIFYGEPVSIDESLKLKTTSDAESECASWVSLYDLHRLNFNKELRYEEPLDWAQWLELGGQFTPVSILGEQIPLQPDQPPRKSGFVLPENPELESLLSRKASLSEQTFLNELENLRV